jgi:hypothetical protein
MPGSRWQKSRAPRETGKPEAETEAGGACSKLGHRKGLLRWVFRISNVQTETSKVLLVCPSPKPHSRLEIACVRAPTAGRGAEGAEVAQSARENGI